MLHVDATIKVVINVDPVGDAITIGVVGHLVGVPIKVGVRVGDVGYAIVVEVDADFIHMPIVIVVGGHGVVEPVVVEINVEGCGGAGGAALGGCRGVVGVAA